jgi:hypothetical protein
MILGLDISTKTTGVSLFEDKGDYGELKLLKYVSPKVKDKSITKFEELLIKDKIFSDEFLEMIGDINIDRVIIEEPLLRSNNVNTVGTLLRFNTMIGKSIYDILGVIPDFISSYDARAYGFPELKQKRKYNKKGIAYTAKQLTKLKPVLFGGYPYDVDKKLILWEKVDKLFPGISWEYSKKGKLKTENYDMSDSIVAVLGFMRKEGLWK